MVLQGDLKNLNTGIKNDNPTLFPKEKLMVTQKWSKVGKKKRKKKSKFITISVDMLFCLRDAVLGLPNFNRKYLRQYWT